MTTERTGTHEGYDVIGDVHGCHDHLVALLGRLGYTDDRGAFRHPTRQAVFVGDLIDRGPGQLEVLRLVHEMVDHGSAQVVLGNHEFNAMAFATERPKEPEEPTDGTEERQKEPVAHLRERSNKNLGQHLEFLTQIRPGSADHEAVLEWFATIPLWLNLDGLRVVHACWDQQAIDGLDDPRVGPDRLIGASTEGTDEFGWIEHLCKGPEVELPDGDGYFDPGGHWRTNARYRWWDPRTETYATACEVPSGTTLPDTPIEDRPVEPYRGDVPVVFGHYWKQWPEFDRSAIDLTPRAVCTDFSAVKGGPLVAYRWSGESTLTRDNLVAARPSRR